VRIVCVNGKMISTANTGNQEIAKQVVGVTGDSVASTESAYETASLGSGELVGLEDSTGKGTTITVTKHPGREQC
jgi:hypothetical protein